MLVALCCCDIRPVALFHLVMPASGLECSDFVMQLQARVQIATD